MSTLAFDHPLLLLALPLALLPLFLSAFRRSAHPRIAFAEPDRLSRALSIALPLLGSISLCSLLLGLAGLHRTDQTIQREGRGAHLMILIDRSSSMESTFANRRPDGAEESKANGPPQAPAFGALVGQQPGLDMEAER